MQTSLPFHLDEHVPSAVAEGLRRRGIDVTLTHELGLSGADDSVHIAFALQEERVIVTHDRDFPRWHARGVKHAGIAYCYQQKYSIGELVRALLL
jgi:predicted nuclease of predicted toxin-antitoxin system